LWFDLFFDISSKAKSQSPNFGGLALGPRFLSPGRVSIKAVKVAKFARLATLVSSLKNSGFS
jgi:hypothetical protein